MSWWKVIFNTAQNEHSGLPPRESDSFGPGQVLGIGIVSEQSRSSWFKSRFGKTGADCRLCRPSFSSSVGWKLLGGF